MNKQHICLSDRRARRIKKRRCVQNDMNTEEFLIPLIVLWIQQSFGVGKSTYECNETKENDRRQQLMKKGIMERA